LFNLIIILEIYFFISSRFASCCYIKGLTFALAFFLNVFLLVFLYDKITKKDIKYFLPLLLLPIFSFIGIYFYDADYKQYLSSYINYYNMILNFVFFTKFIIYYKLEKKFLNIYINIILIIIFIGYLQFLHFINIEGARTYITSSYQFADQVGLNIRATSLFSEPSAYAPYLSIAFVISYFLKRIYTMVFIFIASLTTLSLTAYFEIFTLYFVLYNKKFLKYKFIIVFIFFSLFIFIYFWEFLYFIYERIATGSFGSYRTNAPLCAIKEIFNHWFLVLSGLGLGQIKLLLASYNLSEQANTTHFILSDIFLENGLWGLLMFLLYLFYIGKLSMKYLIIYSIIVLPTIGYRSANFILIGVAVLVLYYYEQRKNQNAKKV